MTTNKTPIQELIDYIDDLITIAYSQKNIHTDSISHNFELLRDFINKFYRQKEKAFAFDCFEAGIGCLVKNTHSITFTDQIDFKKEFESFYAEQHNK